MALEKLGIEDCPLCEGEGVVGIGFDPCECRTARKKVLNVEEVGNERTQEEEWRYYVLRYDSTSRTAYWSFVSDKIEEFSLFKIETSVFMGEYNYTTRQFENKMYGGEPRSLYGVSLSDFDVTGGGSPPHVRLSRVEETNGVQHRFLTLHGMLGVVLNVQFVDLENLVASKTLNGKTSAVQLCNVTVDKTFLLSSLAADAESKWRWTRDERHFEEIATRFYETALSKGWHDTPNFDPLTQSEKDLAGFAKEAIDMCRRIEAVRVPGTPVAAFDDTTLPAITAERARIIGKVLLMITELGEALEQLVYGMPPLYIDPRTGKLEGYAVELADDFIRLCDDDVNFSLGVFKAALLKNVFNGSRQYKHGKTV